jgi:hypothetical protein
VLRALVVLALLGGCGPGGGGGGGRDGGGQSPTGNPDPDTSVPQADAGTADAGTSTPPGSPDGGATPRPDGGTGGTPDGGSGGTPDGGTSGTPDGGSSGGTPDGGGGGSSDGGTGGGSAEACTELWTYTPPEGRFVRFPGVVDGEGHLHGAECDTRSGEGKEAEQATCEYVSWDLRGQVRFRHPLAVRGVPRMMRVGEHVVLTTGRAHLEGRLASSGQQAWALDAAGAPGVRQDGPLPPRATGMAARGDAVLLALTPNDVWSEPPNRGDNFLLFVDARSGQVREVQVVPVVENAWYVYSALVALRVTADGEVWGVLDAGWDGSRTTVRLRGGRSPSPWESPAVACGPGLMFAATREVLTDGYYDDGGSTHLYTPEHLRRAERLGGKACSTGTTLMTHVVTPGRVAGIDYEGDFLESIRVDAAHLAGLPDEAFLWPGRLPSEWKTPVERVGGRGELLATAQGTLLFAETQGGAPRLREFSAASGEETLSCPLPASGAPYARVLALTGGQVVLGSMSRPVGAGDAQSHLRALALPGRTEAPKGWVSSSSGSQARDNQER